MSQSMRLILAWLRAHPGVTINCEPHDDARPMWSHYWRDSAALAEMSAMMPVLGGTVPNRVRPTTGGTPRLTASTFRALVRRRAIAILSVRKRGNGWSAMNFWQLPQMAKP